jgi:hypothetical protein
MAVSLCVVVLVKTEMLSKNPEPERQRDVESEAELKREDQQYHQYR